MAYCSKEEVKSLFGDISDEPSDEMLTTAIDNSAAWIESNLKRNYVPIPPKNPAAIKTVAIYHSASDLLLSLYHGDELPAQYDVWFQKAQSLLDDYIAAYLHGDEIAVESANAIRHVKHSKAKTYNQKRGRRGVRGWAR